MCARQLTLPADACNTVGSATRVRSSTLSKQTVPSIGIKRWAPKAERTTYGFYKNVSVRAQMDPFTGEWKGTKPENSMRDEKGNEEVSGQRVDS